MAKKSDEERLGILVEARVNQLEKDMKKAQTTLTGAYGKMKTSSKSATGAMEADMLRSTSSINRALATTSTRMGTFARSGLGGMTAAFAVGLAPILSVTAALGTAKAALGDFDRIGKGAKSAGVDAEFFQELAYAAELGGVEVSQLSQALNSLNRNAGMAAVGKGELVEKLKLLHPELLANITATTTQEQRIRLVADAIDKEADASRKAAIAAAVFGDAGVKMVEVFRGGAAALDATATKARELGLVIDNDLIARAETMNDEFNTATKVMDIQFKQAMIDLAPFLISTAQLASNLATSIGYITDSMQDLASRGTSRLTADLADIDSQLASANAEYAPGVVGTMGVEIDQEGQDALKARRAEIMAELKKRAIDQLRIDMRATPGGDASTSVVTTTRTKAAEAALKEAEAVKKLIDNLEFERSLIGLSAVEQAKMTALRQAGAAATDEQRAQIAALVEATDMERQRVEALQEGFELLGDIGKSAVAGIVDALADGKIEADEFGSILSDVLGMAGQFFLNQAFGGLGSLFGGGGGFGGFRANGGPVQTGVPYVVGERRPELFVPDQPGTIVPYVPQVASPEPVASQAGPQFSIVNHVDARGATADAAPEIARQVTASIKRQIPDLIRDYNKNPYRRTAGGRL